MRIRPFVTAISALLAALAVFAAESNAYASGGGGSSWGSTPPTAGGGQGTTGSQTTTTVRTCSIYGGPNGFGLDCLGGSSGGASFAEILGGDAVPTCWDQDPGQDELQRFGLEPQAGKRYVDRRCLMSKDVASSADIGRNYYAGKPIQVTDKDCPTFAWTADFDPQAAAFNDAVPSKTQHPPAMDHPYDCHVVLTSHQKRLLETAHQEGAQIPFPALTVTPVLSGSATSTVAISARVNEPIAFVDAGQFQTPGQIQAGGVPMRAVMTGLTIGFPAGTEAVRIPTGQQPDPTCSVAANAGDTPESLGSACWYKFVKSSASQTGEAFNVTATASWQIQYQDGGLWRVLTSFTKYDSSAIRVGSVQALVVPN